jgi:Cdc6-like AAA superfamily ATPase
LKIFDNFASPKERIVLQTVLELAKEKKSMKTSDILENVQKRVRQPASSRKVLDILHSLEEHGFIRRTVVSVGNTPMLVWKA